MTAEDKLTKMKWYVRHKTREKSVSEKIIKEGGELVGKVDKFL
jgi:hypothetical protein